MIFDIIAAIATIILILTCGRFALSGTPNREKPE